MTFKVRLSKRNDLTIHYSYSSSDILVAKNGTVPDIVTLSIRDDGVSPIATPPDDILDDIFPVAGGNNPDYHSSSVSSTYVSV